MRSALDPNWEALPAEVPPRVVQVVRACLQKPVKRRIAHIQDVRLALDGAFETEAPQAAPPEARRPAARRALMPMGAAVAPTPLVAGLVGWTLWPAPGPGRVSRFEIATSPVAPMRTAFGFSDLALSPDRSRIAYVSGTTDTRVWVELFRGEYVRADPPVRQ